MNYSTYFAIEKKLKLQGFSFHRSELIQQFTLGQKTGLSDLNNFEYSEFIKWLNQRFALQKPEKPEAQKNDVLQNQRRKIIALFRKMGYQKDGKADMQRIYQWVKEYGYLHKSLNQYNEQELPKLVTQAEKVYTTYLRDK